MFFPKTKHTQKRSAGVIFGVVYALLCAWNYSLHSIGRQAGILFSDLYEIEMAVGAPHVVCIAGTIGLLAGYAIALLLIRADKYSSKVVVLSLGVAVVSQAGFFAAIYWFGNWFGMTWFYSLSSAVTALLAVRLLSAIALEGQSVFLLVVIAGTPGANAFVNAVFHIGSLQGAALLWAAVGSSVILLLAAFLLARNASFGEDPKRSSGKKPPLCMVVHLLCWGICFGALHMFLSSKNPTRGGYLDYSICVGAAVAAALLVVLVLRKPLKPCLVWQHMRGLCLPATLVGLAIFLIPDVKYASVSIVEGSSMYYDTIVLAACCLAIRETPFRGGVVFSVVLGIKAGGFLLGQFIGTYLTVCHTANGRYEALVALLVIVIILLAVGSFWVGDDDKLKKWWGLRNELTPKQNRDAKLEAKCHALASRKGLSSRQAEVLLALAQGKNAPEIKDELFLSVSTVRVHIRHIYEKLDVHSREELKHMVETASEYD